MLDLKPQFISTQDGARLVVVTEAEWDAILEVLSEAEEDAADIAAYVAAKARLADGRDHILPVEVSAAITRGVRLLKALRIWRDMTQTQLAAKTGLTQSYLSDLEAGHRSGTPETLALIAQALDVPLSWLPDAKTE
jgi:DNA-binding Xre family transcriptional regulator